MPALTMITVCGRLCKGLPVRLPAMKGDEFAVFLSFLKNTRMETRA